MKTVFSNAMCAHVWAQQTQSEGRSNSMRFADNVIYSYDTPIAAFHPDTRSHGVVLITSHTYSVTTSGKHMNAVCHAIGGLHAVFVVPDIGYAGGRTRTLRTRDDSQAMHAANIAHLCEQYRERVGQMLRANKWDTVDARSIENTLSLCGAKARDYATTFGITAPTFDYASDAATICERRARIDATRNSPEQIAKREREEQRKAEKARLARIAELERAADSIRDWRADIIRTYDLLARTDISGGAMLRIRGDNVETSQGASVPISHAARVFRFVNAARKRGLDSWTRSESEDGREAYTLGHFTLNSFDALGIRAGCHFITWKEIDAIAPMLLSVPA